MNREEWVKEETTLGLVAMLIEGRQRFVEISESRWQWRRNHKLRDLSKKRKAIGGEISVRYDAIVSEMAGRVKVPDAWTETEFIDCQNSIWQLMHDHAQTMTNYRKFSGELWEICCGQLGYHGNVAPLGALRPKFMLRQFVDEMPSSDQRGALRTAAFGKLDGKELLGRELLDSLRLAFPLLHLEVLRRIDDLSALTDGEITPDMARNIKEPYMEYRRWLFES